MTATPTKVQGLVAELNAGDVGYDALAGGAILRYEGFTGMCWEAHVERFGEVGASDGVAVVETEMHGQWLAAHPGTRITHSGWEGGCEPWDDCVHWAILEPVRDHVRDDRGEKDA